MPSRSSSGPVTSGDRKGMVRVAGGSFLMGSEDFYPEEQPVHRAAADGFWMDVHPVTVAEFQTFVSATGHVTTAERAPDAADYPDASPEQLVPGSLVFRQPNRPVPLHDFRAWWAWVPGAQWRHPEGPDSTTDGLELHPVTHVSHADALAYAAWAGKSLPTEVEWELAARGGLDGAVFAWGDEFAPGGQMMANTWQGDFPLHNEALDGYQRTSPVGHVSAQRLRPVRRRRQRVGVDRHHVHASSPRGGGTVRASHHRRGGPVLRTAAGARAATG